MENRFKIKLGCEVVPNTFYGWLLGAFWARIGIPNSGQFSQIGDPERALICFASPKSPSTPFFVDCFWCNFREFGSLILVYFVLWCYPFHDNLVFRVEVASNIMNSLLKLLHARCKVLSSTAQTTRK